jgi:colanic acid biosynthesis glycosyl transferase WcaI
MKLLFLTIVYRPEPVGYRAHDLASGLVELGHQVTVVTGLPSYPYGRAYEGYHLRPWQWETLDGVRVLRLPYTMDRSRSALRRVLSYSYFAAATSVAGLALHERPSVIWTNQIGLSGIVLNVMQHVPFVHEVQDMWPEWSRSAGLGIKDSLYRLLDWQQAQVYRRSAAITTISRGFQRWLVGKGVPGDKIQVIPNWVNERQGKLAARDEALAAQEGLAGHFNVIYAGNIGAAQGLGVVLQAAPLLTDLPEVQFVVYGDGVERSQLEKEAQQAGLRNVRFMGSRPAERISDYLALADVLLLQLKRDPAYEVTIPSKTYTYLASGRPILAAAAGDVAALVSEVNAGLVVAPEDPAALAEAVRKLYRMPAPQREAYGRNARRAHLQYFDRSVLIRRYEELFVRVAHS